MSLSESRSGVIDSARAIVGRLGRLRALLPGLLFVTFVAAFVGVGAAAKARSLLPTLACVAAALATLAALAAWTLIAERFTQRGPGHVAWHPRQWAEFERAFWSYVDGSWDPPPRAAK
jgi:hypothetical protein